MPELELDCVIDVIADRLIDGPTQRYAVIRMHQSNKRSVIPRKCARSQSKDLLEFLTPPNGIPDQVTAPRTHAATLHCKPQHFATLSQFGFRAGGLVCCNER